MKLKALLVTAVVIVVMVVAGCDQPTPTTTVARAKPPVTAPTTRPEPTPPTTARTPEPVKDTTPPSWADPVVRRWLAAVLDLLADPSLRLPVLFHCTSGKDRAGVVVAAVLTVLGVDRGVVIQEYLWSEGEVRREWIDQSLVGIGRPEEYLRRCDLNAVRARFAG